MYHPKCVHCRSSKTIKHGGKRWVCKRCHKTFSLQRKDVRDRSAILGYVEDRSTYKRLGTRWKVHRSTAYRRVQRALAKRYTLLTRTKQNLSLCDGVLVLDGKWIYIRGKLHTCFVAWDRGFKRPIHFLLKEGGEKELWYWKLLVDLERLGYKPKAFISDGIASLKEMLEDRYPNLPHQRCTVHIFLAARAKVAWTRRTDERSELFIELMKRILWSRTLEEAQCRLYALWETRGLTRGERDALQYIHPILHECFVCREQRFQHLQLPRSSNAIENVIGHIEARLKTRRGNKSFLACEALVNDILLRVEEQTITHN